MRFSVSRQRVALPETRFDGVEAAVRAKKSLNGADIYSGCCTLKIEYAKSDPTPFATRASRALASLPCKNSSAVADVLGARAPRWMATPTRLNVYKNDPDSWDYTNPNLGGWSPLVVSSCLPLWWCGGAQQPTSSGRSSL
ncbi:hypothetical protein HPB50_022567 [Hyalomma asiaticum]|uniref:Uncharacterized protein n=1 Tax=Hyalomma asiaticum TaxID=266040 RepID=A0ACB7RYW0_HYAAI|nr:hypothetical protein HPB50_022567 [Hyalomma asiaticum]